MTTNELTACGRCGIEHSFKKLQEIWSAAETRFINVCTDCLSEVVSRFKNEDNVSTVTAEKFEHETYPQLELLTTLMETYGGEISFWAEDTDGETLQLDSEGYLFVMKRDGELHVTHKETENVFFIGDPTFEAVESMLSSMGE